MREYDAIFKMYENEGIIKRVDTIDDPGNPGEVHYLPHRPVVKYERETTKVRPVFDASAKSRGPSLNDCLYTGPCLLNHIFGIILRFRMYLIGICSDIKQAFLNIGVSEEHQNYLRFIWFNDPFEKYLETVTYKFARVLFGLAPSPFLLNATVETHIRSYDGKEKLLAEKLLRDLYVDDSTAGVKSVNEGIQFYKFAKRAMKEGGFDLTKWCTNSLELMELIGKQCMQGKMFKRGVSYKFGKQNRTGT